MGQAQAVGLDTEPEARSIAGEGDVASIGARGTGDLLPISGGDDVSTRGPLVAARNGNNVVAVAYFEADDLYRRFPERPCDPVPRLDILCQGSTPARTISQGVDKTRQQEWRADQWSLAIILPEGYSVIKTVSPCSDL